MPARLTTETFIEKAKEVHGDRYDYSKVQYKNSHSHVIVICRKHGEFLITPNNLLRGRNCPKCKTSPRKMSLYEFIRLANLKHNNKYDYSKVEYKNCDEKVCIICPIHGEFWQTPYKHLHENGCPKCGGSVKLTTEEFIGKAKTIHEDRYDYSKTEYINNREKVCIICKEHGEFWQIAYKHLEWCGCPKCSGKNKTTEDFIKQSKLIHGENYDYSRTKYVNSHTKICITCPIHGDFWQNPNNHLQGKGCPICSLSKHSKKNTETFIKESTEIHNWKYDYSKTTYVRNTDKVIITCPKHGDFLQTPKDHLRGNGCPKCKRSILEEETEKVFIENNIIFTPQFRSEWLKLQTIDFFIPSFKLGIECQGIQHYEPVEVFGGEKSLKYTIDRDLTKIKSCADNNIELLYIFNNNVNISDIINKLPDIYNINNSIHISELSEYLKQIKVRD